MPLVPASVIAAACGVHYKAVVNMALAGRVPSVMIDGELRFDDAVAIPAVRLAERERRCSVCGRVLPVEQFRKRTHRSGAIGYSVDCTECHKKYNESLRRRDAKATGRAFRTRVEIDAEIESKKAARLSRWQAQQDAWAQRRRDLQRAALLTCTRCGVERPRCEFHKSMLRKLTIICKPCWKKRDSARFQAIKADPGAYARRLSSPIRRLRNRVDGSMRAALGRKGAVKDPGVFRHLGYTVSDLRRHIERTFAKGMSWSNMDEWHIDHIVPVAAFTFSSVDDPGFRACYALTNLRALWAEDNLSKGSRMEYML